MAEPGVFGLKGRFRQPGPKARDRVTGFPRP